MAWGCVSGWQKDSARRSQARCSAMRGMPRPPRRRKRAYLPLFFGQIIFGIRYAAPCAPCVFGIEQNIAPGRIIGRGIMRRRLDRRECQSRAEAIGGSPVELGFERRGSSPVLPVWCQVTPILRQLASIALLECREGGRRGCDDKPRPF